MTGPRQDTGPGGPPPAGAEIEYFTDPLCSWSWALEPAWRRLRHEFRGRLAVRLRMGGMIPGWDVYHDPLNSVGRPAQMAPQWFEVRQASGMPIDERLWLEDPPDSSYPACLAVKTAERQSPAAAEAYLRRLREAALCRRRNIAREDVLLAAAGEVADGCVGFDAARFTEEVLAGAATDAFRDDLMAARYREIGRFPALILRGPAAAVLLVGYRPYKVLRAALERVAPDIGPPRPPGSPREYADYWGGVVDRELEEVFAPEDRGEGDGGTEGQPSAAVG